MDFEHSERARLVMEQVERFVYERVVPNEQTYQDQLVHTDDWRQWRIPPVLEELKAEARELGLWNLFLPDDEYGAGLDNRDYAPIAEITGRSPLLAPEAINCAAPDTGNMEIIAEFGSTEQQERWLVPLLEGEIRSCFGMTEPDVASSDARNIQASIARDGDEYVINGRKWWSSGAKHRNAKVAILMGCTNPAAAPHERQSQIVVPFDTPGFEIVRTLDVFGYDHAPGGHCEILLKNVRVPVGNILLGEGRGFEIAQARLGPGRIHHCMRCIGVAERAFEIMCSHANNRVAFGGPLGEKQFVQEWVATSRMEIDQARLLTLYAAHKMDTLGKKAARQEISMIKVVVPNMMMNVLDRVIQSLGAMGVSDDTPVAAMWRYGRSMRLADGPDEVHKMVIARRELRRFA